MTEILAARELPADFGALAAAGEAEGHGFMPLFVREWDSGENRFDRPGEAMFLARDGGRTVGVGGLNRDPYSGDADVGRLRHLFVHAGHRGSGLGSTLSRRIIEAARGSFRVLRLRSFEAGAFYERLGFERTDEPDATHRLVLG